MMPSRRGNMSVKLEEGFNHWRAATFAYESTAFPMLSGTLITCAGFLPLALAEGMVAEFTKSLSIVVFMALIRILDCCPSGQSGA